ncbi:MAG TPA: cyclic nucleotide-binding and patatin-like phospholipase domain-containing protein [Acidobacteriota bacterium]|nr:cyclic nucleotide-binding and patatin-like phospholipase domain-containing protein [Acidobacteriota bacterium]
MAQWMELLSTIPIFSFLSKAELEALHDHFVEVSFGKGDTVCRVGDPGNTFYVVLSGELEVWGGSEGKIRTGTLRERDFFGEMALLQGGKRTATVTVARRARLLALDKESFERLFLRNPKAVEYFARVLCKRLASVTKGESGGRATMTISVASLPGLKGKSLIASALAGVLKDITRANTLVVQARPSEEGPQGEIAVLLSDEGDSVPASILEKLTAKSADPAFLSIATRADLPEERYGEKASNLISKLSDYFSFIVFDLCAEAPALIAAVPEFSDVFIQIVDQPDQGLAADGGHPIKLFRVLNLINTNTRHVPINSCEPFVIPKDSSIASDQASAVAHIRRNPKSAPALPIHRMARKLLRSSIGIALGGGAAFGIAHLGVLQVLEQNNIPIDLVAGCSQGSIIGVGYAAGVSVQGMISMARQLGRKRNFFKAMDFTITKPGILAGNRIVELFSPLLGDKKTFEDLVMPCRTIATDIESGERVAIGDGRLDHAFRASSAVPMVISPLKWHERALVDGGVSDPVPAEIVTQMGADFCIAVNVVPPLKRGIETVMSRAYRTMNRLNPLSYLGESQELPNLFDIVMNSMQILQYELGNFKAISADVLINPDLTDFTWIEYYRAEELINRGIEAAEKAMPAIQKAIDERLAPVRKAAAADAQAPA